MNINTKSFLEFLNEKNNSKRIVAEEQTQTGNEDIQKAHLPAELQTFDYDYWVNKAGKEISMKEALEAYKKAVDDHIATHPGEIKDDKNSTLGGEDIALGDAKLQEVLAATAKLKDTETGNNNTPKPLNGDKIKGNLRECIQKTLGDKADSKVVEQLVEKIGKAKYKNWGKKDFGSQNVNSNDINDPKTANSQLEVKPKTKVSPEIASERKRISTNLKNAIDKAIKNAEDTDLATANSELSRQKNKMYVDEIVRHYNEDESTTTDNQIKVEVDDNGKITFKDSSGKTLDDDALKGKIGDDEFDRVKMIRHVAKQEAAEALYRDNVNGQLKDNKDYWKAVANGNNDAARLIEVNAEMAAADAVHNNGEFKDVTLPNAPTYTKAIVDAEKDAIAATATNQQDKDALAIRAKTELANAKKAEKDAAEAMKKYQEQAGDMTLDDVELFDKDGKRITLDKVKFDEDGTVKPADENMTFYDSEGKEVSASDAASKIKEIKLTDTQEKVMKKLQSSQEKFNKMTVAAAAADKNIAISNAASEEEAKRLRREQDAWEKVKNRYSDIDPEKLQNDETGYELYPDLYDVEEVKDPKTEETKKVPHLKAEYKDAKTYADAINKRRQEYETEQTAKKAENDNREAWKRALKANYKMSDEQADSFLNDTDSWKKNKPSELDFSDPGKFTDKNQDLVNDLKQNEVIAKKLKANGHLSKEEELKNEKDKLQKSQEKSAENRAKMKDDAMNALMKGEWGKAMGIGLCLLFTPKMSESDELRSESIAALQQEIDEEDKKMIWNKFQEGAKEKDNEAWVKKFKEENNISDDDWEEFTKIDVTNTESIDKFINKHPDFKEKMLASAKEDDKLNRFFTDNGCSDWEGLKDSKPEGKPASGEGNTDEIEMSDDDWKEIVSKFKEGDFDKLSDDDMEQLKLAWKQEHHNGDEPGGEAEPGEDDLKEFVKNRQNDSWEDVENDMHDENGDDDNDDEVETDEEDENGNKKKMQNPKKIWHKKKNKRTGKMTKSYFNGKKSKDGTPISISAKDYQEKVKAWNKAKQSKPNPQEESLKYNTIGRFINENMKSFEDYIK